MKHSSGKIAKKQPVIRSSIDSTVVLKIGKIVHTSVPILFSGFLFFFLLWYIDPAVLYSSNGIDIHNYVTAMHEMEESNHNYPYSGMLFYPPFILEFSDTFINKILLLPGGFLNILITLIIHLCHYPLIGAIVITVFSLLFFLITARYFKSIGIQSSLTLSCILSLFLLISCGWYELDYIYFLLPVAGALIFTTIFECFKPEAPVLRMSVFSLFFWLSWYLFQWGSFLFLIFAMVRIVFSEKTKNTPFIGISFLNATLLLLLDFFVVPIDASIKWARFTAQSGLPLIMILILPCSAVILILLNKFLKVSQSSRSIFIRTIIDTSLLLFVIITLVLWLQLNSVNRDTRTISRTCANVVNGRWNKVLTENTTKLFRGWPEKAGTLQAFMIHSKAHALASTGQIGEKLFHYPQRVFTDDPLLFLESTNTNGYVNWFVVLELAMDLGMVNTAEKIAGEIMENVGPLPDILFRRVLIQIAKGNVDAASVYLRRLSRMPVYSNESQQLHSLINDRSKLFSFPRIASMRANMDTTDYFLYTTNYDYILLNLLNGNPANKLAFDYLMSYYLRTGQSDRITEFLQDASTAGYSVLPRLWEEGICVYNAANFDQGSSGSTSFSGLHPSTVKRFNEFARACMTISDDNTAATRLAPLYGNSYFFYSIFRYSPGVCHE